MILLCSQLFNISSRIRVSRRAAESSSQRLQERSCFQSGGFWCFGRTKPQQLSHDQTSLWLALSAQSWTNVKIFISAQRSSSQILFAWLVLLLLSLSVLLCPDGPAATGTRQCVSWYRRCRKISWVEVTSMTSDSETNNYPLFLMGVLRDFSPPDDGCFPAKVTPEKTWGKNGNVNSEDMKCLPALPGRQTAGGAAHVYIGSNMSTQSRTASRHQRGCRHGLKI